MKGTSQDSVNRILAKNLATLESLLSNTPDEYLKEFGRRVVSDSLNDSQLDLLWVSICRKSDGASRLACYNRLIKHLSR